jgi:hypothetical protein
VLIAIFLLTTNQDDLQSSKNLQELLMKIRYIFIFIAVISIVFTVGLAANQKIQQKHLMMFDMDGGCGYCHNNKTGIQKRSGQFLMKGQKNYFKLSKFKSAGCAACHTRSGLSPKGKAAKADAGL